MLTAYAPGYENSPLHRKGLSASLISDAHRTRPAPLSGKDGQGYCTAPFRWTVPSSPNCGRGLSPQSRTHAEYEPSTSPRGLYLNQDILPPDGRVSGRQRPRTEAVCPYPRAPCRQASGQSPQRCGIRRAFHPSKQTHNGRNLQTPLFKNSTFHTLFSFFV